MASTARDVIKAALRKLGVLASGEEPSATEAADCLSALNAMMFSWSMGGIAYTHVALALSDPLTLDDKYTRGVIYLLAVEIAPEFGVGISKEIAFSAAEGLRTLQAGYDSTDADFQVDNGLLDMSARYWGRGLR